MVRSVAGNLPEQVKNNQSVNTAAGNGGQKMSQYSWFTVYDLPNPAEQWKIPGITSRDFAEAQTRFELVHQGVADPRLTTWLLRLEYEHLATVLWSLTCDPCRRR